MAGKSGTKGQINLKIPKSLSLQMTRISDNAFKGVIRRALRAAARPPRRYLKKELMLLRNVSPEATGASWRAVDMKVNFPAKTNGDWGYMYAGVDMQHYETHVPNTKKLTSDFSMQNLRRNIRKDPFVGMQNMHRVPRKGEKKFKTGLVKSYQKSRLRKPRGWKGPPKQNNQPGKYWHILEEGARSFSGYHFKEHAVKSTEKESIESFERILKRGIKTQLGKT